MTAAANIAKFRHYVVVERVTPTREAVVGLLSDVAEIERELVEARDALRLIAVGTWNFGNDLPGMTVVEFARGALAEVDP